MDGMPGASLHSSRTKGSAASQTLLDHFARFSAWAGKRTENFSFQVSMSGHQPRCTGSRYTMPQRLTVAGDATAKSLTSNITVMLGGSLMRSPLARHNILLSSNTVFMFSIQMASTGPSRTTHWRLPSPYALAASRTAMASTPSVHSCVLRSDSPYNCPCVILFGFMTYCVTGMKVSPPSAKRDKVSARTFLTFVLPHGGMPTVMRPWRTMTVSHNWITLPQKGLAACKPFSGATTSMIFIMSPVLLGGSSTPGKRSPMIPSKSGRSAEVNFGRFTSMNERSAMTSSGYLSPMLRFPLPPATNSAFKPRMPKS
mmetsp:Transcript_66780/g.204398  ORF Transcript_66780/g.204398 Transcript_66780/m.204398 type:complete len:313 (-) Transcript_66780:505-1443(-)